MNSMLKRVVVGLFASAMALVPLAAPASAAPSAKSETVKVAPVTPAKPGGVTTYAIDWE